MINNEEIDLVIKYIHLPLLRKVLEADLIKMENAQLKFKEPYLLLIERMLNKIGQDIREIKKEMSRRGITVYEKDRSKTHCKYLIVCRGYQRDMNLMPHLMKIQVEEYLIQ